MSAPVGNQNAVRGKRWRDAIERALARKGGAQDDGITRSPSMKAMDDLADKFVENCSAGDLGFFREFGDRIDGKPKQQVEVSGDAESPLESKITVEVVRAGTDPTSA